LTIAALGSAPAPAATFPAACSGTTGDPASLVSAIDQANAVAGADTVQLGNGCRYELTAANNHWYGPNGLPAIASEMTIEGSGSTIARAPGPAFRLFFVGADESSPRTDGYVSPGPGRLTLRNLTLDNGLAQGGASGDGGGGAGMGGAIFSQGTVVIEGSTLTGNIASGGRSGCISFPCLIFPNNGGGIGADATFATGGGFGPGSFGGGSGGTVGMSAPGGGAGFRFAENGQNGTSGVPGDGGGPATGTGGSGGKTFAGSGGNGGGGGGQGGSGSGTGSGGAFGSGGRNGGGGGGGGVGGGGGHADTVCGMCGIGGGGGGGFGGGGGSAVGSPDSGRNGVGGSGGFGGGGGRGGDLMGGGGGAPGFGGGAGTSTNGGGGAGLGGAVFNMQGELTIRNSTLTGNTAIGGADNNTGPNRADGLGGAVFNMSGTFTAVGATFAANTAAEGGASIYNLVYDGVTARVGQTTLRGSIVSGGLGPVDLTSAKPAQTAGPTNLGTADAGVGEFDLVRSAAVVGTGTVTGSPLTADPLLGPLADNGGPTGTMAPAAGSPAIDAGAAFGLTTDQRGLARPSDFFSIANAGDAADIGAVELQSPDRPSGGGGGANGAPQAFGANTLVTLRLAVKRIPAKGPLPIAVSNANPFPISGAVAGRTTQRVSAAQRRRARLRLKRKTFQVGAQARKTVKLSLSRKLRRALKRDRKLSLKLTATVGDPAGTSRTVGKTVSPKLRKKRRR
jgi:hypothetical protein